MANPLFAPLRLLGRILKKTNLTFWILIALPIGIGIGAAWPKFGKQLKTFSDVFLHMIKCLVTPLIFSTLYVGIVGHEGDLKSVGRLAIKALIYFEVVSTFALAFGLIMGNIVKPGKGASIVGVSLSGFPTNGPITWQDYVLDIFPTSFFQAASENKVLQVVFCAIMFSTAALKIPKENRDTMTEFLKNLADIMFKVTGYVMFFAPIGIVCITAYSVGTFGLKVLLSLGKLVLTCYATLLLFIFLILVPILLVSKVRLIPFLKCIPQPMILAFTTASSESALPIALKNLEDFGIPKSIVSFVLPTGYSFNLDGSTLYLSLAALFCAQASEVHLSASQQVVLMLTLMLSSKGIAAVPRASIIVLYAAVESFGIPKETVALILGADVFMDMARTCTNLTGNCVASVVIARWEGAYPPYGEFTGRWEGKDFRVKQSKEHSDSIETTTQETFPNPQLTHPNSA
ncbi:Proton glutamate symport protein [Smittium culicis]|uniref:Amino acid transporter n=1 Tax=Smittium culicis TaxID=133412 RepID=A0A1R1YP25_9FUNG|nr:Proton glutamate symport protein [Smittium culicis]